jgi:hypothetical protein
MIAAVHGRRAWFCGDSCREGFTADRDAGLIYGPYRLDGLLVSVETFSLASPPTCAYCNAIAETADV